MKLIIIFNSVEIYLMGVISRALAQLKNCATVWSLGNYFQSDFLED
jgi:hypothetical protein